MKEISFWLLLLLLIGGGVDWSLVVVSGGGGSEPSPSEACLYQSAMVLGSSVPHEHQKESEFLIKDIRRSNRSPRWRCTVYIRSGSLTVSFADLCANSTYHVHTYCECTYVVVHCTAF